MSGLRRASSLAAALTLTALLLAAPQASALEFGLPGSDAGQTDNSWGLTTDFETGLLYVAEAGNNRISAFEPDGEFVLAFGWGVDTGAPELEVCTTASTCQAGIAGSGPGQFSSPRGVAVDNDPTSDAYHDLYVFDGERTRVQRFHPNGEFVSMFGGGVLSGGATGTGNLTSGSTTVSALKATSKAFVAGQLITGPGIPSGTTVASVNTNGTGSTLTLSQKATANATGAALTAPEAPGNVVANERQSLTLESGVTGGTFTLTFPATQGKAAATTAAIASNASPGDERSRPTTKPRCAKGKKLVKRRGKGRCVRKVQRESKRKQGHQRHRR